MTYCNVIMISDLIPESLNNSDNKKDNNNNNKNNNYRKNRQNNNKRKKKRNNNNNNVNVNVTNDNEKLDDESVSSTISSLSNASLDPQLVELSMTQSSTTTSSNGTKKSKKINNNGKKGVMKSSNVQLDNNNHDGCDDVKDETNDNNQQVKSKSNSRQSNTKEKKVNGNNHNNNNNNKSNKLNQKKSSSSRYDKNKISGDVVEDANSLIQEVVDVANSLVHVDGVKNDVEIIDLQKQDAVDDVVCEDEVLGSNSIAQQNAIPDESREDESLISNDIPQVVNNEKHDQQQLEEQGMDKGDELVLDNKKSPHQYADHADDVVFTVKEDVKEDDQPKAEGDEFPEAIAHDQVICVDSFVDENVGKVVDGKKVEDESKIVEDVTSTPLEHQNNTTNDDLNEGGDVIKEDMVERTSETVPTTECQDSYDDPKINCDDSVPTLSTTEVLPTTVGLQEYTESQDSNVDTKIDCDDTVPSLPTTEMNHIAREDIVERTSEGLPTTTSLQQDMECQDSDVDTKIDCDDTVPSSATTDMNIEDNDSGNKQEDAERQELEERRRAQALLAKKQAEEREKSKADAAAKKDLLKIARERAESQIKETNKVLAVPKESEKSLKTSKMGNNGYNKKHQGDAKKNSEGGEDDDGLLSNISTGLLLAAPVIIGGAALFYMYFSGGKKK